MLLQHLRDAGIASDMDHLGKSLKAQFKSAGKQQASYVLVVGPMSLPKMRSHVATWMRMRKQRSTLQSSLKPCKTLL